MVVILLIIVMNGNKKMTPEDAGKKMAGLKMSIASQIGEANAAKIEDEVLGRMVGYDSIEGRSLMGGPEPTVDCFISVKDKNNIKEIPNPTYVSKHTNHLFAILTPQQIIDAANSENVKRIGWNTDKFVDYLYWNVPNNIQTPTAIRSNAGQGETICILDIDWGHAQKCKEVISSSRGTSPAASVRTYLFDNFYELINMVDACLDDGGDIISMSLGMYSDPLVMRVYYNYSMCSDNIYGNFFSDIIHTTGVVLVAAAGNHGYMGSIGLPGCLPGPVTVGGTHSDPSGHYIAPESSIGYNVDITAPYTMYTDSGFFSGTSASTPFVAGILATLKSATNASYASILEAVYGTAEQVYCQDSWSKNGICDPIVVGHGQINAYQACLRLATAEVCDQYMEVNPPRPSQYPNSCTDGTWNQDELGVDCGGRFCPACDKPINSYCISTGGCGSGKTCKYNEYFNGDSYPWRVLSGKCISLSDNGCHEYENSVYLNGESIGVTPFCRDNDSLWSNSCINPNIAATTKIRDCPSACIDNSCCVPNCNKKCGTPDGCGRICPCNCGNNLIDQIGEVCDGLYLGNKTCKSFHFNSGYLQCNSDCLGYDTSKCFDKLNICGNNLLEVDEVCDGISLKGKTCQSFGYQTGRLGCTWDCSAYNLSLCDNPILGGFVYSKFNASINLLQNNSQNRTLLYSKFEIPQKGSIEFSFAPDEDNEIRFGGREINLDNAITISDNFIGIDDTIPEITYNGDKEPNMDYRYVTPRARLTLYHNYSRYIIMRNGVPCGVKSKLFGNPYESLHFYREDKNGCIVDKEMSSSGKVVFYVYSFSNYYLEEIPDCLVNPDLPSCDILNCTITPSDPNCPHEIISPPSGGGGGGGGSYTPPIITTTSENQTYVAPTTPTPSSGKGWIYIIIIGVIILWMRKR